MTTATDTKAQPDSRVAVRDEPSLTPFQVIEKVIAAGDLASMKPDERIAFYWRTCESLGLNPLTRPFEFINLNGKLTMYARKDATDQLRKINAVTVTEIRRERDEDLGLLTVYARGRDRTGREDEATGVVFIKGLGGESLANAVMKAETKAKRRLTLSLVGLGFLDESELDGADVVDVDPDTGEIIAKPKPASLIDKVREQQAKLVGGDDVSREMTEQPSPADIAFGEQQQVTTPPVAEAEPAAPAVAEPEPLSAEAFLAKVRDELVENDDVVAAARTLFPGIRNLAALTDQARGQLWAKVLEQRAEAKT